MDSQAQTMAAARWLRARIMPIADNIEKVLNGTFAGEHVDPERVLKTRHPHVPQPRTNKKYIDPSAASRLHPHAAETSAVVPTRLL